MADATTQAAAGVNPVAAAPSESAVTFAGGAPGAVTTDRRHAALLDVQHRFTYHAPKGDQGERYTRIRDRFRELAEYLVLHTPPGREQSTALTKLDEAMMMANAAIARGE